MNTTPFALVCICSALVVSAGCATNPGQSAPQTSSEAPPVRTITLAAHPMPSMKMMTPGKAAAGIPFGLIGYAISESAMSKEGHAIVQKYHLDDPAVAIGTSLRDTIAAGNHLVVKDAEGVQAKGVYTSDVVKAYPGSSEILDVRTTEWRVTYLNFDLSHYGVQYGVEATLIDGHKRSVIATANCSHFPKRSDTAPTHDEMLANDAAQLKILSAKAAERCVAEMLPQLLGKAK
jgi:hypothetical protein